MAIVPFYPRLIQYIKPIWPVPYPAVHPYIHWHPMIVHHFFQPSFSHIAYQSSYSDSLNDHKIINATYNPGNFWIWPSGQ